MFSYVLSYLILTFLILLKTYSSTLHIALKNTESFALFIHRMSSKDDESNENVDYK